MVATACRIISHLGGGLYAVELIYDTTLRDERIKVLSDWLTDVNNINKQDSLDAEVLKAVALLAAENEGLNTSITLMNSFQYGTEDHTKEKINVEKHTVNALLLSSHVLALQNTANRFYDEFNKRKTEQIELSRLGTVTNPLKEVWCLDLADGIDGRAIYIADEIVDLYCLNYDPDQLLLPNKNNTALVGGEGGRYNAMRNFPRDIRSASTFYNVALECGYARWQPLLMSGTLKTPINADCRTGDNFTVYFPPKKTRYGDKVLLQGEYKFSINKYWKPYSFDAGDEVVCIVKYLTPNSESDDFEIPTIELLGFLNNPKIQDYAVTAVGQHGMAWDSVNYGISNPGEIFGSGDFVIPVHEARMEKIPPNTKAAGDGTGVPGVFKFTIPGYDLSGDLTTAGFAGKWTSSRTELIVEAVYEQVSENLVEYTHGRVLGCDYVMTAENPKGGNFSLNGQIESYDEPIENFNSPWFTYSTFNRDQMKVNGVYGKQTEVLSRRVYGITSLFYDHKYVIEGTITIDGNGSYCDVELYKNVVKFSGVGLYGLVIAGGLNMSEIPVYVPLHTTPAVDLF